MITRRTFLKRSAQLGVVAAAAPMVSSDLLARLHGERALALDPQPLRIPPVISGGDLHIAAGKVRVYSDADTNLLLLNNSFPSPTIKVRKGDTFSATIYNELTEETVLHWHGVHAPAGMSGHPKDVVAAGASYTVNFPIQQRASINFYHPHPHMNTARQVYMGLAGFFLIEDDEEAALRLPAGEYDVPLMIQDKRVDANRQLVYNPAQIDLMSAWLGETIMINGTPNAYLDVARTLYRFRVVNASNGRFYKLALADGKSFTIVGNDGGFLDAPCTVTSANLAPGERLDILIDFSSYAQGESVIFKTLKFTFSDGPGTGNIPQGAEMNLLEFRINKAGVSDGVVPTSLPAIEQYKEADVKHERVWDFAAMHHISERTYDMAYISEYVPFGQLEKWKFDSEAANTHPIHVHGAYFQVLSRLDGIVEPYERGWKDVVRLDPLKSTEVLVKFDQYPGEFVIHCHKLEHADQGMMANFVVESTSSVEEEAEYTSFEAYPNPAINHSVLRFPVVSTDETLSIFDAKGSLAFSTVVGAGSKQYRLNTRTLAGGAYLLVLGRNKTHLVVLDR